MPLLPYSEWSASLAKNEREGIAPRLVVLPLSFRSLPQSGVVVTTQAVTHVAAPAEPKPAAVTPPPAEKSDAEGGTDAAEAAQAQPDAAASKPSADTPPAPAPSPAPVPSVQSKALPSAVTGAVSRAAQPAPAGQQPPDAPTATLWQRLRSKLGTGEAVKPQEEPTNKISPVK